MESEDAPMDEHSNSNSKDKSQSLDYDQMMSQIINQNQQLKGPLIPQKEYLGDKISQEEGVGEDGLSSMNYSGIGYQYKTKEFSSNTNQGKMYKTGHHEDEDPRRSVHLSQQSFRSCSVSGEEFVSRTKEQPYADEKDQKRERSGSSGRSKNSLSDPLVPQIPDNESDRAIKLIQGHAREESNFLFSKQSQISSRQLVSKMSQDFNEILAGESSTNQPDLGQQEVNFLQTTEERNDEEQSEQYQSLKRHIFGSRPALQNVNANPEQIYQFDHQSDQIQQFELKNNIQQEESQEVGSFHSTEQQSESRGCSSNVPETSNDDYIDKDQPLIETLAKIQEIMQQRQLNDYDQSSLIMSNNYLSAQELDKNDTNLQAQYDLIVLEMITLKQQLLMSRHIIQKDQQMKMKLVLKLKEQNKEIEEMKNRFSLISTKKKEIGTQVQASSIEGELLVNKEYCDKYIQTLPQLLVSEKLDLESGRAYLPARAGTFRQSFVSFTNQLEHSSRNHGSGFRPKRHSLMKGRNAPRLYNFEQELSGIRHSCLSTRHYKLGFNSSFDVNLQKEKITNKLERLRTLQSEKQKALPTVASKRKSLIQHKSRSSLLYEEFKTQNTAKPLPASRLSLLNRDWKSQISEENSVASSPLKAGENHDKIRIGRKGELDLQAINKYLSTLKRGKSYQNGDFDKHQSLDDALQIKRRNSIVAGDYPSDLAPILEKQRPGFSQLRAIKNNSDSDSDSSINRIEEDQAEDETEELKTSYDSDKCPFQQSQEPEDNVDDESDLIDNANQDENQIGINTSQKLELRIEIQAQGTSSQIQIDKNPSKNEALLNVEETITKQVEQEIVPMLYPDCAEERQAPPVPPLRALLPGPRHLDLQKPIFSLDEPGSPNAGFLNVNIKKSLPKQNHHQLTFNKTHNLRGQLGKTMSLSDLARHKHFASVTAETNQYFWKAKFQELLNEKKRQMKQIHDLNQNIQSQESEMVTLKNQMKESTKEKEITIEELIKEIVHCRIQIQQLNKNSLAFSNELNSIRSSIVSEAQIKIVYQNSNKKLPPKKASPAPGSLEAALKTITESLSSKILKTHHTQKAHHYLKTTRENLQHLQSNRNGKQTSSLSKSKESPSKQKKVTKSQYQMQRDAQLAQRNTSIRQVRTSIASENKKYIRKNEDKEERSSSIAKVSSQPKAKRTSNITNDSAGSSNEYLRKATPIVELIDPAGPDREEERERSNSHISLDQIDVADIDESLLRVSSVLSNESTQNVNKAHETVDSFAIADDFKEQKENEGKQKIMIAPKNNRNPSLNRGILNQFYTDNENPTSRQTLKAYTDPQQETEITMFSQKKKLTRNLILQQPPQNPLEGLLSINFKNDDVPLLQSEAKSYQTKVPSTRTRDSVASQPLSYSSQYQQREQYKRTQIVDSGPPPKSGGRPSLPYGNAPLPKYKKPQSAKRQMDPIKQLSQEAKARGNSGKLKLKVKKNQTDRYKPYLVEAQNNVKFGKSGRPTFALKSRNTITQENIYKLPEAGANKISFNSQGGAFTPGTRKVEGSITVRSPRMNQRLQTPSDGLIESGQATLNNITPNELSQEYHKYLIEVQDRQILRQKIQTIDVPKNEEENSDLYNFEGDVTNYRIFDHKASTNSLPDQELFQRQKQIQSARDKVLQGYQENINKSTLKVYHQVSAGTRSKQPFVVLQSKSVNPSPLKPVLGKIVKKEIKKTLPTQSVLQRGGGGAASRTSLSTQSAVSQNPGKQTKIKAYASSRSNLGGSLLAPSRTGTGKIGRIVPKKQAMVSQSFLVQNAHTKKIYSQTSRNIETKFAKFLKGNAPQEQSPSTLIGKANFSINNVN